MHGSTPKGVPRRAGVVLSWLAAVLAGVVVSPVLTHLFDLTFEPPGARGELMASVVAFLVSGFVVYLLGGVRRRQAHRLPRGPQRRYSG